MSLYSGFTPQGNVAYTSENIVAPMACLPLEHCHQSTCLLKVMVSLQNFANF